MAASGFSFARKEVHDTVCSVARDRHRQQLRHRLKASRSRSLSQCIGRLFVHEPQGVGLLERAHCTHVGHVATPPPRSMLNDLHARWSDQETRPSVLLRQKTVTAQSIGNKMREARMDILIPQVFFLRPFDEEQCEMGTRSRTENI